MSQPDTRALHGHQAVDAFVNDLEDEHKEIFITAYLVRLAVHAAGPLTRDLWRIMTAALLEAPGHCGRCVLLITHPNAPGAHGEIDRASRDRMQSEGWECYEAQQSSLLHAKTALFGSIPAVWVGSHNLTRPAWLENQELSIRSTDPAVYTGYMEWWKRILCSAEPRLLNG